MFAVLFLQLFPWYLGLLYGSVLFGVNQFEVTKWSTYIELFITNQTGLALFYTLTYNFSNL